MKGNLYIVSTPIGNLSDITLRALETLKNVDIIACENKTRHLKLLNFYNIQKPLIEYSPANELNSAKGIIDLIYKGKNVALVTDAGTPNISDPGKILLKEALKSKINIVPIPGVSALNVILSICDFPINRVIFLGFLPKSVGKIEKELILYKDFECIIILFVSHYQIKKVLNIINKIIGNSEIIIGREMTKINEEFIRARIEELMNMEIELKGEFTIAIWNKLNKK